MAKFKKITLNELIERLKFNDGSRYLVNITQYRSLMEKEGQSYISENNEIVFFENLKDRLKVHKRLKSIQCIPNL